MDEKARKAAHEVGREWANGGQWTIEGVIDAAIARYLEASGVGRDAERYRRDAERYRWLRQMIYDDRIIVDPDRMLSGVALDAAIDTAMQGGEGRG